MATLALHTIHFRCVKYASTRLRRAWKARIDLIYDVFRVTADHRISLGHSLSDRHVKPEAKVCPTESDITIILEGSYTFPIEWFLRDASAHSGRELGAKSNVG